MQPAVRRPRRQRGSSGLLDTLTQSVSTAGVPRVDATLFYLTVSVGRSEWHGLSMSPGMLASYRSHSKARDLCPFWTWTPTGAVTVMTHLSSKLMVNPVPKKARRILEVKQDLDDPSSFQLGF